MYNDNLNCKLFVIINMTIFSFKILITKICSKMLCDFIKVLFVGSLSIHCFKICDILIKYGRSVHNFMSWLLETSRGI